MNIDLHFHTCISKYLPIDLDLFRQSAVRAREQGVGAIGITDHHDGPNFPGIYATLDKNYEYNGHYYLVDGVRYYPGVEVAIRERPHLLVLGQRHTILTFYNRLRPHVDPETYPTLEEFFTLQSGLDVLNIFAHPLRPGREIDRVERELIAGFDALDLNAKDLRKYGPEYRQQIEQLARERNLPVMAGGDSHHFYQVGCVYNDFPEPFETIAELRELIRARAFTLYVSPDLDEMVETAQALKRVIKEAKEAQNAQEEKP